MIIWKTVLSPDKLVCSSTLRCISGCIFRGITDTLSSMLQQCAPHDKESDYWGGGRGAKQGYEVRQPTSKYFSGLFHIQWPSC